MLARRTLTPGQKGTKKLLERYGPALIYVRYRYDEQRGRRYTTVELIVEDEPWTLSARIPGNAVVGVQIGLKETALQRAVKQAGGKWNPQQQVWELRYDRVKELGLESRLEPKSVSNTRHPEVSYIRHLPVSYIRNLCLLIDICVY